MENETPKNYEPLPSSGPRPARELAGGEHHVLVSGRISGTLHLRLTTMDPLRVGRGVLLPIKSGNGLELAQDLMWRRGLPVLPGSTLKGVVRSLVEALGGGCELEQPCDPLCVACGLFGTVQRQRTWAGRVSFEDALPSRKKEPPIQRVLLPRAFAPRRALGRRVYGPAVPGVKADFPALAVRPGTTFATRLHLENLREGELGLVLLSLGLDGSFAPRFGGGKYHGLGRVWAEATRARFRLHGYVRPPELLEGEALAARIQGWIGAAELVPSAPTALTLLRAQMGVR